MLNKDNNSDLQHSETNSCIVEDKSRLSAIKYDQQTSVVEFTIDALKQDQVVLVQDVEPEQADQIIFGIAQQLGLSESLELQAAFASSLGHRQNIGRYYMSVNERDDYQFVTPHSEGSSFTNMQLASFYCYENSTDGGETIVMNVEPDGAIWQSFKEQLRRGKAQRALTAAEISQIKSMFRLNMPEDTLRQDDEVLAETPVVPGFTIYDVLAKPQKTWSTLLGQEVYAYWDSIDSINFDSVTEFQQFLQQQQLFKPSPEPMNTQALDADAKQRIRHFGNIYQQLFKCYITHKMKPGEFMIQNNLSWTHAVNHWTPGSGVRKVAAAFA